MSLEVTREVKDNVFVVTLKGRAAHSANQELNEILNEIKSVDARGVVFDMRDLTYLNSMAIGSIIEAFKLCTALGKKFCLASLRPEIEELFRLTGLLTVIPVASTLEEAINKVSV